MTGMPTTSTSRLVAKLLERVIIWYASWSTVIVRPRWAYSSGSPSRFTSSMYGRRSTMLVNLLRTWTGASAASSPRVICRCTASSTASFMVEAAWKGASAL
jgi:hypothetical protein